MSPEDFKNIAQGLQALLIGFAVIVGGVWAVFRFRATKEKEKSELEFERMRLDAKRQGGIDAELSITHKKISDSEFYLYCDVVFNNYGMYAETLTSHDYSFRVNKVENSGGTLEFEEVARMHVISSSREKFEKGSFETAFTVRPNTPVRRSLFCVVDSPGNYMVSIEYGCSLPKVLLEEDNDAYAKQIEEYDKYRTHPNYNPEWKWKFSRHKHYHVA